MILTSTSAAAHLRGELTEGKTITLKTDGKVRYTVPQTVTVTENTADVTVYFRPADVWRDVTVTVREGGADGNIISKKKRIKVAPGEMETITIKATDLTATTADTLYVSIEDSAKKGGNA